MHDALRAVSAALHDKNVHQPVASSYCWAGDAEMKTATPLIVAAFCAAPAAAQISLPDSTAAAWNEAMQRAVSMSRHGEYREAVNRYRELLLTPPLGANTELRAYLLSQMADAQLALAEYREAEAATAEALRNLESAGKTHTAIYAITEGVLADTLRAEGNYGEAKRLVEHALALATETLPQMSPRIGILLTILGQLLQESGELPRAEQRCRRAVAIFEAGSSDASLGNAYQNLAVILVKRGKFKPALDAVRHAIDSWNQAFPTNDPFLAYALSTKIAIYQELRQFREAEQIIPQALDLALTWFGPDHPERMILLNNCAGVYVGEKKYAQAEALFHEASEIGRLRLKAGHPLLNNVLLNYSYVLGKLNRKDEAARAKAESEVLLAFPDIPMSTLPGEW